MFKKLSPLIAALLMVTSANSFANGWTGEANVVGIYAMSETQAIIKLSAFNNLHNCQVNEAGQVVINPSTNKVWFSMLLAAYASKQKVDIFISSNCIPIWNNTSYAEVIHVRLI